MSKRVKEMLIDEIREQVGSATDLLILDSSRMDAVSDNKFRAALREKDIRLLTVRNTFARKALGEAGMTGLDDALQGPSVLVWGGEDIVSLSKEMAKWARDIDELEIKGGSTEGTPLSAEQVDVLSKSPGREELIGRVVMLALSPGAQLAAALLGPGGKVVGQLKAMAEDEDASTVA